MADYYEGRYNPSLLAQAVYALTGVCDGAVKEDARGWSGADQALGHRLAGQFPDMWTAADRHKVYVALRKYRVQLGHLGLDYDKIPPPPVLEGARTIARPPCGGTALDVCFPYEDDLGGALKAAMGREYATWNKARHCWEVTLAPGNGARLLAFARAQSFVLEAGVAEYCQRTDDQATDLGTHRVTLEGAHWVIAFPYDPALVDAVKALPRRRWDGERKVWTIPTLADNAPPLQGFIIQHGFRTSAPAQARLDELGGGAAPPPPRPARRVEVAEGGGFWLFSPFDEEFTEAFKEDVPSTERTWQKEQRRWHVVETAEAAEHLLTFCAQHDVHVPQDVVRAARTMEQRHKKAVAASRAASADLELPGFGTAGRQPYPFQRAGIQYALNAKTCFIADDMGVGKSCQALGVIHTLGSFPTLIVCPATVKLNWRKEIHMWLPGKQVEILDGVKPTVLPLADLYICNYDILHAWQPLLSARGLRAVVLDESHYIKGKSRRTQAALAVGKGVPVKLCLSGTPVLNRPAELVTQLEFLGRIKEFGGGFAFLRRFTNAQHNGFGWDFSGAANLSELNTKLRGTCFVRRRKADVLKELPPKTRADVPLEIDNRAAYERAEEDVALWFAQEALRDAEFLASIAHLSPREQAWEKHKRAASAEMTARRAEQLLRFEALKTEAVRGKMAAALEWITDFLESGEKLVLFAHHKEIQKQLLAHLAPYNPAHLFAEDSPTVRQANVDRFQTDEACRVIDCSLIAGGIGVTLTAASNACILELGWNAGTMTQAEDRLHRIGQGDPVTIWYLLADDTIDAELADMIRAKQTVVDQATEGQAVAEDDGRTLAELGRRLAQRHRAVHQEKESA